MTSKIIKDGDLIETARRQIDSIAVIAEQVEGDVLAARLRAYISGLRNTVGLIEARMVRAR